jgi:hypothetical protein
MQRRLEHSPRSVSVSALAKARAIDLIDDQHVRLAELG